MVLRAMQMVATSTDGVLLVLLLKATIFDTDSWISCKAAKDIITERIIIAIGSNFVRPENKEKRQLLVRQFIKF